MPKEGLTKPGFYFYSVIIIYAEKELIISHHSAKTTAMPDIIAHAFRLKPGQDIKKSIRKIVNEQQIKAGWISTCVGSLTTYNIRFANK